MLGRLFAALLALLFVLPTCAGEKYLWTELLAFDNAVSDYGVSSYLARMAIRPKGVSLLLTDPEIVHVHRDLAHDFEIGDQECSYCARPWNEERKRQRWTAWQLRGLVTTLKQHGVEAYPSFFDFSMPSNSSYLTRFKAVRKPRFWLDDHPEVCNCVRDGSRRYGVCVIKHLADGTLYQDFFSRQLVRFLKDYGFAGWHACDGFGHPRSPVLEGDFSDDVVAQFVAQYPVCKPPAGLSFSARADWILAHARCEWSQFYARRHVAFIATCAKALKREGLSIWLNTSWTCDPFEALYRYGVDYRRLARTEIDGFFAEASATVLTLEGWVPPPISKLDRCRAAFLCSVASVDKPFITLACIKDGMEQYNSLRHAPALVEAESLGLQALFRANAKAFPDVLWCLTDGITQEEWQRLDALRTLLPPPVTPDGVRVVCSDDVLDSELLAYCRERYPSSYMLLTELLHRGASLCSAVTVQEALANPEMPLLLLNPAHFASGDIAALCARKAPVVMCGMGASESTWGPLPKAEEPVSWLTPLPVRVLAETSFARTVREINACAYVYPDENCKDLRVMAYRAQNDTQIVVALNNRATYLNGRIIVRAIPKSVRALTASPSLPVQVKANQDSTSFLPVKLPPYGCVVLSLQM